MEVVMDYLVCKCGLGLGLGCNIPLENIKDEEEAISKAQQIAIQTKEGATVGLFTRDANVICGWKVLKDAKLRGEPVDVVKQMCGVESGNFDLAKREVDKYHKSSKDKQE